MIQMEWALRERTQSIFLESHEDPRSKGRPDAAECSSGWLLIAGYNSTQLHTSSQVRPFGVLNDLNVVWKFFLLLNGILGVEIGD